MPLTKPSATVESTKPSAPQNQDRAPLPDIPEDQGPVPRYATIQQDEDPQT